MNRVIFSYHEMAKTYFLGKKNKKKKKKKKKRNKNKKTNKLLIFKISSTEIFTQHGRVKLLCSLLDGMDTRKVDRLETQEVESNNLEEENRMLKERSLCKVCLDATACVLFLECGHMVACPMCAPALANCPVCRAEVKGTLRAHFATDR